MNRVQLEAGLSLPAFLRQFATEAALEQLRCPQGLCCAQCGGGRH